ncbi:hypothetical protein I302_108858 [Kwoniella bestiolae CBS 10118]|uniref:Cadmium ion transporter n=1 Tax=Kwoniella bestiolae CBS 10118 TaxID=1296100 RepID=A0AAJ8MCD6_9TREE
MIIPFWRPTPAPAAAFKGQPFPYRNAGFYSKFILDWAAPSIMVAWSRGLEEDDLYDLTPELQARLVGDALEANYMARVPPSLRPDRYRFTQKSDQCFYDQSLFKAIYKTVWRPWWWMVLVKLVALGLRAYIPLMIKDLLTQISRAHEWYDAIMSGKATSQLEPPASVAYMVSIGFGMWLMIFLSSTMLFYANWRSKLTGKLMNPALASLISRKAMRLSGKSRTQMTDGKITTMVSVDTAFIDPAVDQSNETICTPAQIIASLTLLFWQLGWSASVGLAVTLLVIPLKAIMFKRISKIRRTQNEVVDERVRLLSEVLHNIRAVKLYAYEAWFGERISDMRLNELKKFQSNNIISSGLSALMSFLPTLAAILTFIFYALMGNKLDAAVIFSSLQYFSNLQNPIAYLPEVLTTLSQAAAGITRINEMLQSDERDGEIEIDPAGPYAIDMEGDFQFEGLDAEIYEIPPSNKAKYCASYLKIPRTLARRLRFWRRQEDKGYIKIDAEPTVTTSNAEIEERFSLIDVDLKVPRGALVCIVGRVGTGKTALLSALTKEMKQTKGHVKFGGSLSYAPQQAWVLSGSVRDNITFFTDPEDVDLRKVERIIDACGLRADVEAWPDKDLTIIGERGVTLSGGQRQRLCVARAAYANGDIVLLDDPLSAVDAHVGHHLLDHCILNGPLSERTRVLVTHHLDVLPHADLVLVMDRAEDGNGRIIQQGSYADLISQEGIFQSLIEQYGAKSSDGNSAFKTMTETTETTDLTDGSEQDSHVVSSAEKEAQNLILPEDKAQGDVSSRVYRTYIASVRSAGLLMLAGVFLVSAQGATVLNIVFLGHWSEDKYPGLPQGGYTAIYAGLGVALALLTWGSIFTMFSAGIRASFHMFDKAWTGVMRSPTSWHDRTPTGRIINRLSKDIEILDDKIASTWYNVFSGTLSIVGVIALVLYTYPIAGLIFIPILYFDYLAVVFYLEISREINRLASTLRSHVYTNLGEQLAGMSVIRAFKRQDTFERRLERSLDEHLSAVLIGGFTQGFWLGNRVRLASLLSVIAVTVSGIIMRESISAATFGVVLTYTLNSTSALGRLVGSLTDAIISMNTVERVQHYTDLPSEAPRQLPSDPLSATWPSEGKIDFKDVSMKYRPELPLVLRDVNFSVAPGEKIGIIGRTGSGKSSLMQVLFRLVELTGYRDEVEVDGSGGKVEIDGVDIRSLGLDTLRSGLSIIPQAPFLFSGTIRENIDPQGSNTDAELHDALNLIQGDPRVSASLKEKSKLDYMVVNQGSNFSAGERQLIALIRAMMKKSKILILDEATSSVDLETDSLIQKIIQNEFPNVTLLSIAHRIQTIMNYDKILIMDQGRVVDFDTPTRLYDNPGSIFRKLCDRSVDNRTNPLVERTFSQLMFYA